MTKLKINLNLNKFPKIDNSIPFLKYDPLEEFPKVLKFEDIAERVYGCNLFIGSNPDKKYPNFGERANFRAALSEFASISEIIDVNYPDKRELISIYKTDFPLFHFFKLLRDLNFHTENFKNSFHTATLATMNTTTMEIGGERIEARFFIVENCNYQLFSKKREVRRDYYETELTQVVNWVNDNQKHWGISHLLERTLRQYCEVINNHFT